MDLWARRQSTFTGQIRDFHENGSVSLNATLKGVPHGVHTRRYDNGNIYWEALYNFGVLCGTKITAYESGLIAQKGIGKTVNFYGERTGMIEVG